MCDIKEEDNFLQCGKASIERDERDEADIQKLITMLTTVVSDPFRPVDKPVHNICTRTVTRNYL